MNALAFRPFRYLWLTNLTFFLVSNAQRFVFGWLVLDGLQRDEGIQGIVVFTLGLPAAFLVLQAGAWADRWDRRRMLIATQLAGGVVMVATAVLVGADRISLGWVIVATLLAGSASAIGAPVRSSLLPALVPREQLFGAIALNTIAMTLSLILGPVLAKAIGDQFGFEGAFWFQAALLFIGVGFLMRLEVPPHEVVHERRSVTVETKLAVRHVLDDHHLKTLFGLLLVASMTINPAVMVTLQAHVKDELGRTAGEAAIPRVHGARDRHQLVRRAAQGRHAEQRGGLPAGDDVRHGDHVLVGRSNSFTQVVVLAFFMGLAGGFFITMNQGLIQANTPQPMMGRVMGLYTLVTVGLLPFGALILGLIASFIGVGNAISVAGAVGFAIVVTTYVRNAELRQLS